MPELYSDDKKNYLEIQLLENEYLDIDNLRSDYENWIPFSFTLRTENEIYTYPPERRATFSVYEIKSLIFCTENLIRLKQKGNTDESYDFCSCEIYFEMSVYDTFEKDELYIELWISMGALTEGDVHGYDKGVRFVVTVDSMTMFVTGLKEQLKKYDLGYDDTESMSEDFRESEARRKKEYEEREENLKAETIIKKMLKDGLPADLIQKYTGLTKDQLDRIDIQ